MTPEERKTESILLHEHWNLIQQGIDHKAIKLCNCQILVNKRLHGKVTDFKFIKSSTNSPTASMTSTSATPDSMEQQIPQLLHSQSDIMVSPIVYLILLRVSQLTVKASILKKTFSL